MITVHRLVVGAALCAVLVLPTSIVSQAAGKLSQQSPPLPPNDYSMGRAPQNCPMSDSSMVHVSYNNKSNVVPHRGWWIGRGALVGYSGWIARGHRVTLHFGPRTKYGYPQKVFWQLTRSAHGPVTLHGWNLQTGQRIWFGTPLDREGFQHIFARRVMLVTEHYQSVNVGPPTGRLLFTPLDFIFVPAAGCYMLHAQWKTGSWTLPFAAGCLADPRMVGVAHCKSRG